MSQIKFIVHEWELFKDISTLSHNFETEGENCFLSYISLTSIKQRPKQAPP